MTLRTGELVLVITRRNFQQDLRRHFIGEVVECNNANVRIQGYVFVYDDINATFVKREDLRTRIISLVDAGYIINVLPSDVQLEDIFYMTDERNRRLISDGKLFKMNISEFGANV